MLAEEKGKLCTVYLLHSGCRYRSGYLLRDGYLMRDGYLVRDGYAALF